MLKTLPQSFIAQAYIEEYFWRNFGRRPLEWEINFFMRPLLQGELDAFGFQALLSRLPEAWIAAERGTIQTWPLDVSLWN
jgi:hypothetical protein